MKTRLTYIHASPSGSSGGSSALSLTQMDPTAEQWPQIPDHWGIKS